MEWLRRLLRTDGLSLVAQILVLGYGAWWLWQALVVVDDPLRWIRVLQRAVPLAFVLVAVTFRHLRRPIPILNSPNPCVSALGWVALMYILFGTMFLTALYQPPLIVWILSGILGYGITVVVKQIRQQPSQ